MESETRAGGAPAEEIAAIAAKGPLAEMAVRNIVLRTTTGSGLHGVAVPGTDDRDEMAVCCEPPEYVIGHAKFEQYVHRDVPEGERSRPGDLDLTIFSLRKWTHLAATSGNPSVLVMLFAPRDAVHESTRIGERLRAMAPAFVSKRAGRAFLGYLTAQKQRLLGDRGQMRVHRPELVEAYGYDTKYAFHTMRLGIQGLEFLRTGHITLPMAEPHRSHLMDVRLGKVGFNEAMTEIGEIEAELESVLAHSGLPDTADSGEVNRFLVTAYASHWQRHADFRKPDLLAGRL